MKKQSNNLHQHHSTKEILKTMNQPQNERDIEELLSALEPRENRPRRSASPGMKILVTVAGKVLTTSGKTLKWLLKGYVPLK